MENDPANCRAFIPAWLDDADLTTSEFRVLCRIIRRGDCVESAENIAAGCRINKDTVWPAIQKLIQAGIISRTTRPGRPTLYRVKPTGKGGVPENEGCPSDSSEGHWKRRGGGTGKGGVRRYSLEGTPTKVKIHTSAEAVYNAYPRKVGKPAALRAISSAIKRGNNPDEMLAITQRFGKAWEGEKDLTYCPHPATWFNQDRFLDAPESWRNGKSTHEIREPELNQRAEKITVKSI